jgi:prepilin-type N-terminal cleavage/methylation domain-containing protein
MNGLKNNDPGQSGFSLIELLIGLSISLVLMATATSLLARSINIRRAEDQSTQSLADVQRALNLMTREITNSGYGLSTNGVVGCNGANCDSNRTSIRFRSNLDGSADGTLQEAEDVKYFLNTSDNTIYLARFDPNTTVAALRRTVLANRIDALQFFYFNQRVGYTTVAYDASNPNNALITNARGTNGAAVAEVAPTAASYVVIVVAVRLDAVGRPGADGYQPPRTEMLTSDVALRNTLLTSY